MTPTTYGRDFAYCLKSHGGVRGFNASLWQFLLRCTLFCHSVATFLTSVSSYEGGCGFEVNDKIVRLKPYDSRLLYLLCVKFGELADEDYLIEGLWGMADSNKGGSLRRCINHLRKILADDIEIMIKNQYSRGYTLATLKLDSLL